MKKKIPPILLFIFSVLSTVFVISCEDNEIISNSDQDQDTIAVVDTVRFGDLTTLFENRCYHCHSEPEYSFYALNLDT